MALGCDNFRTSTLTRHLKTDDHQSILAVPKERTAMETVLQTAQSKEEIGINIAFKAVYWLAQENIAMAKYFFFNRLESTRD